MFVQPEDSQVRPVPSSPNGGNACELESARNTADEGMPEADGQTKSAKSLFRPEAIAARQAQWMGTVLIEPRRSHRLFTLLAALAALGVVGLFFSRDVTHTTRVTGWLVPKAGLVRVFAPQAGVVAALHVKEGAAVKKGEQLLTLSGEVKSVALGSTQAEVTRLLAVRRQMLVEQRNQIYHLLMEQEKGLAGRLASLRAEQGAMEQEISLQKARLQLARDAEVRQRELQRRGFITYQYWQQQQEARLTQAGRLASLERERLAANRERLALEGEIRELPLKTQTEMSAIDRDIAAIEQQLAEAEARREIIVVAPQGGTVTAILADPGGHVTPAAPLLTVVPNGSKLEAHLYGPSRAVGFVRAGQRVSLRYQAYPYEKFGHYLGTVVQVSGTPIGPGEVPLAGSSGMPAGSSEALYRITVELDEQTVTAYGQAIPLQPGMRLEADVTLDKRRLYEWVLDPLYAITGRMAK